MAAAINFRSYKPNSTVWPLSFMPQALNINQWCTGRKRILPAAHCSSCWWHLAVNNAISKDKMLWQWLFNLSVLYTEVAGSPTSRAWTGCSLIWFLSVAELYDWNSSCCPVIPRSLSLSLPSCLSLPASQGHLVWSYWYYCCWCWLDTVECHSEGLYTRIPQHLIICSNKINP